MQKLLAILLLLSLSCKPAGNDQTFDILPGAYQLDQYLPLLTGKNVGLTVNQSSLIGTTHLTDTLLTLGVSIDKVFTPEHGFKGTASDGAKIEYEDGAEPFELISLYGKNKKPTNDQLSGLDMMVFDIQDVGTRFYTYISTMHYVMEACAENNIPILILDRPNPNGSYVDGPVLDTAYSSFVGMHPIPIVHGMTVGELARMINGEGWLTDGITCDLNVIEIQNWEHSKPYSLPIKPSPNLPDDLSISLYPSLCLFEGTIMSVGRGTDFAFQQIGHPEYPDTVYSFTPRSREGAKWPPYEDQICYGVSWIGSSPSYEFTLQPLIDSYLKMGKQEEFFNDYFKRLVGSEELERQIRDGWTEEEIRKSWEKPISDFKLKRKKYVLYD